MLRHTEKVDLVVIAMHMGIEEDLRTVEEKLKNKSFVDRAPKQVVQLHRQRQKNFAEQLRRLKEAREKL